MMKPADRESGMPDLTRETLAELRALLKRQADALASVEMKPDSAKAYEALNAANRALVKEAYCHLPALLDAAERGLEAEERKQKALKLMARKRAPGLRSPAPPRERA